MNLHPSVCKFVRLLATNSLLVELDHLFFWYCKWNQRSKNNQTVKELSFQQTFNFLVRVSKCPKLLNEDFLKKKKIVLTGNVWKETKSMFSIILRRSYICGKVSSQILGLKALGSLARFHFLAKWKKEKKKIYLIFFKCPWTLKRVFYT